MDRQKETENVFYKVRGVKTCIVDGLKLLVRDFVPLMRMMWIPLLIAAFVMALLTRAMAPLVEFLSGISFLSGCAYGRLWLLVKILHLLFVILVFGSLCLGQLASVVSLYIRKGYIPRVSPQKSYKYMFRNYVPALIWNAGWIVTGGLFAGLSTWLVELRWTLVVTVPAVFLLLFVPYCLFGIKILIDEQNRITWREIIIAGYQYWGRLFSIVCLCGLLAFFFIVVGCLPAGILSFAEMSYQLSVREGDLVTNPAIFLYARIFFSFIGYLVSAISLWAVFFPMAYQFASLCERKTLQRTFGHSDEDE